MTISIVLSKIGSQILTFLVGVALTALVAWIKAQIRKKKQHDKVEAMTAAGIKWLLRGDILKRCDVLLNKTTIDLNEWDSLREENGIYRDLGGNGDVAARMKLVGARVERQEVTHG